MGEQFVHRAEDSEQGESLKGSEFISWNRFLPDELRDLGTCLCKLRVRQETGGFLLFCRDPKNTMRIPSSPVAQPQRPQTTLAPWPAPSTQGECCTNLGPTFPALEKEASPVMIYPCL